MQDIAAFYCKRREAMIHWEKQISDLKKGKIMSEISYNRIRTATITAFYALSLTKFHMNSHVHDSCEIMYATSGSCLVEYGDKQVKLSQGRFVFLDAGVPHKLIIEEGIPCSVLNLEFQCGEEGEICLDEILRNSHDVSRLFRKKGTGWEGEDLKGLGYSLKDLISYLQREKKEQDYLLTVLFYRFLLELAGVCKENRKRTGAGYLIRACEYIEKNLRSDLKVADIAAYAGINKSYLQLLFSRIMDCTITSYINQKRIEQASFLLVNSVLSVTDIAFETGYNSRQHFSSVFERYRRMTPVKYRKLYSKALGPDTEGKQYLLNGEHSDSVILEPEER